MKHIKLFDKNSDYQEKKDSLEKPYVCLVKETGKTILEGSVEVVPSLPDIEIFADSEYTLHPQEGQSYDKLYVRINKEFSFPNTIDTESFVYLYRDEEAEKSVSILVNFTYMSGNLFSLAIINNYIEEGGGHLEGQGPQTKDQDKIKIPTQDLTIQQMPIKLKWYEGTRTSLNWSDFRIQ